MNNVAVHIVYEGADRPFTAARVEDPHLVRQVAERAVFDVEAQAEIMDPLDPILAGVQREEAQRLRRVLELIVPGLKDKQGGTGFRIVEKDPGVK